MESELKIAAPQMPKALMVGWLVLCAAIGCALLAAGPGYEQTSVFLASGLPISSGVKMLSFVVAGLIVGMLPTAVIGHCVLRVWLGTWTLPAESRN